MEKKILDEKFRKDLYKALMDAGYEKGEAQKIVGDRYFVELKADVLDNVYLLTERLNEDKFSSAAEVYGAFKDEMAAKIAELEKLYSLLYPSE